MIEQLKAFIEQARAQGMDDATLRVQLKAVGTPDLTIAALLPPTMPSLASLQALASLGSPAPMQVDRSMSAEEVAELAASLSTVATTRLRIDSGRHLVEIEHIKLAKPEFYGKKFFVEYRVLETTSRNVVVGGQYTFSRNATEADDRLGKHRKDIREFVALVAEAKRGISRLTWDPSLLEWIRGADQPARGLRMIAEVEIVKTKAGHDFAKYEWLLA